MIRSSSLTAALIAGVTTISAAQPPAPQPRKIIAPQFYTLDYFGAKTRLGFSTSAGGAVRDTLGIAVEAVQPGSAAEKAGIEEGNRIAAINGVNLRLSAGDVGDADMAGIMGRRLQRELQKLAPGDTAELRVWRDGRFDTVRLPVAQPESRALAKTLVGANAPRASIGATIGGTRSPRDTAGVFVAAVVEGGPLAKAGIYEGSRIASINGVDLRVPSADAGDAEIATARANRLLRELEKVEPGANVELRVWQNGQTRTVTVQTGRFADLHKDDAGGSTFFFRDGNGTLELRGVGPGKALLDAFESRAPGGVRRVEVLPTPAIKMLAPFLGEPPRIKMDEPRSKLER